MVENCPFCRPGIEQVALWEGEHYRIIADEFPVCAGHVLLLTKEHLPSHVHAPAEWMSEFEAAQDRVRQFLLDTFGRACFIENGGGKWQTVPHAHLHGVPIGIVVSQDGRGLLPVLTWQDVRREWERSGCYVYVEALDGRYLVPDCEYEALRKYGRAQLASQTEAQIDPTTGKMVRWGAEVIARTGELWRDWSKSASQNSLSF